MKKGLVSILILLLCIVCTVSAGVPEVFSLKLRGTIPVENVKIFMVDENNIDLGSPDSEIAFEFASGVFEPISHTIDVMYSANLDTVVKCAITFELSDLEYGGHKIETDMELQATDTNVITTENSMEVEFAKGSTTDHKLGTIIITATKDASNMLPTGDYEGALTIKYTSLM